LAKFLKLLQKLRKKIKKISKDFVYIRVWSDTFPVSMQIVPDQNLEHNFWNCFCKMLQNNFET
jgi:hypothetical protein